MYTLMSVPRVDANSLAHRVSAQRTQQPLVGAPFKKMLFNSRLVVGASVVRTTRTQRPNARQRRYCYRAGARVKAK